MKILVVSYLFPNCVYPESGIFVLNRLKAISRYCEVKVINPIPWFPGYSKFGRYKSYNLIPEKETIEGIEVFHPRFFIIPKYLKVIDAFTFCNAVIRTVRKRLREYKFDLIDLHWTYPDIVAGFALSKITNKKFIVTVRGKEALNLFTDNCGKYYEEKSLRTLLLRKLLPRSDKVISLSIELQNICIRNGVSEDKAISIRNGVNTKIFKILNKDDCRMQLNIPVENKIIVSVGTINIRKGYDRIVKALSRLESKYNNLFLYIIGSPGPDGDYSKELNRLIHDLKLEKKVNFVGHVENHDLLRWYNAADLFCLASRGEGSPNVLTEALACGCPSVATDVGAVKDILSCDFLGCVVPNNELDISEGIIKILTGECDRKRIEMHMRKFDWNWCAQKVIREYRKMIEA